MLNIILVLITLVAFASACETNEIDLNVLKVYSKYASEEKIFFYKDSISDENLIFKIEGLYVLENKNVTLNSCIQPGNYVLLLKDTSGDGWGWKNDIAYVVLSIGNLEIYRATMNYVSGTTFKQLTYYLTINPYLLNNVQFKYTDTLQTDNAWKQSSYDDSNWSGVTGSAFPIYSSSIRYYRIASVLPDIYTITTLNLFVKSANPFIIYVNGNEIYRYKINYDQSITDGIHYETIEDDDLPKSITFKKYLLNEIGPNTISFVVYINDDKVNTADLFDVSIFRIGTGINNSFTPSRISSLDMVADPEGSSSTSKGWRVLDGDTSTYWYATYSDSANLTYSFPHNNAEYINCYSLRTSKSTSYDFINEWYLYGSNDGITWNYVDYRIDTDMSDTLVRKEFFMPSNIMSYRHYRFNFVGSTQRKYAVSELELSVCDLLEVTDRLIYEQDMFTGFSGVLKIDLPCTNSAYSDFTVIPQFPDGLSINPLNGYIRGIPIGQGTSSYCVKAINRLNGNMGNFTIVLTLNQCTYPEHALISLFKTNQNYAYEEEYTVFDMNDNILFKSPAFVNKQNSLSNICIPFLPFKIHVNDTYNDGWTKEANLEVSISNGNTYLHMAKITNYKYGERFFYFDPRFILNPYSSSWVFMQGSIPSDWYKLTTTSQSFVSYSYTNPPVLTSNVWLFRNTFMISELSTFAALDLKIYARAGFIVYLNEEEMIRTHISTNGDISLPIEPTISNNDFSYITISVSPSILHTGSNTICVAIINNSLNNTTPVLFDAVILPIQDNEVGRLCDVIVTSNPSSQTDRLIDYKTDTEDLITVSYENKTASITYNVSPNKYEYFNKFCMTSSNSIIEKDPTDFYLEVSNDDISYSTIFSVTRFTFTARLQEHCFYIPQNKKGWRYYRFVLTKNRSNDVSPYQYAISELHLAQFDASKLILPPLSYNTTQVNAISGLQFPAISSNSPMYSNYRINPSLPSPLYIDQTTGQIIGILTEDLPLTEYTITAQTPLGDESSTKLNILVSYCKAPFVQFTLLIMTGQYASEMQFEFKNRLDTILAEETKFEKKTPYYYPFCVLADTYYLTVKDTRSDGWDSGYYEIFYEDNTTILKGTLAKRVKEETYPVSVGYVIPPLRSEYKYSLTSNSVSKDWNTIHYDDKSWNTHMEGSFGQTNSVTNYFRYTFSLDYPESYSDATFTISTQYGFVVYLNSIEIFRFNMPSGVLTSSTYALKDLMNVTDINASIPFSKVKLNHNENVFAVEVHLPQGIQNTELYYDSSLLVYTEKTYKNIDGIPSSDLDNDSNINLVFDNNKDTVYYEQSRCVGAIFSYTYNSKKRPFVNAYSLTSGNNCNRRHPSGWNFEGSNDEGNTWTTLHIVKDYFFNAYYQEALFYFYNEIGYNTYRMVITECNNTALTGSGSLESACSYSTTRTPGIQLAELTFFSRNMNSFCQPQDGYIGVYQGEYSYKDCPRFYSGYIRSQCMNSTFVDPLTECVVGPMEDILYTSTIFKYEKGDYINIKPLVEGAEYVCDVAEPLPSGISFDKSNGCFYGITSEVFDTQKFTVTCSNKQNSVNTILFITSLEPSFSNYWIYILVVILAIILLGIVIFCIVNRIKSRKFTHKNLDKPKNSNGSRVESSSTKNISSTKKSIKI